MVSVKSHRGFTIVELLIVIVVIAILAVVTIVGYAGISQRAALASVRSELQQVAKAVKLYSIDNAEIYPDTLAEAGVTETGFTYSHISQGGVDAYCLGKLNASGIEYMITSFHAEPVVGSCTGLLGWWPLTNNANDHSGYANDGVVNGAMLTVGQNGAPQGAYLFDKTYGDYIDTGLQVNRDTFSFSLWFYMFADGTYQAVLSEARDCCGTGYRGFDAKSSYPGGHMGFSIWNGGSGAVLSVHNPAYTPLNTWVFMAGTYDGSVLKLYKDGVMIDSASGSFSIGTPTASMKIARTGATDAGHFGGSIDDVRTYNRALTDAEVAALYTAGAQ